MLTKSVSTSLTINVHASYALKGYFMFLLLVFHKVFETLRHFTMKTDSAVHDSEVSHRFIGTDQSQTLILYCNVRATVITIDQAPNSDNIYL
jgi:hypothetical protein